MWSQAELIWDESARRSCGLFRHDGCFTVVRTAAEDLHEARVDLIDTILPERSAQLATGVERFVRLIDQLIEQYNRGALDLSGYSPVHPPWESVDRELRTACEQALDVEHPLRCVLELGIAFGSFDVSVNNHFSFIYLNDIINEQEAAETQETGPAGRGRAGDRSSPDELESVEIPLPSIRDLASRAGRLPDAILDGSPLLRSLSRIAVAYDELGDDDAIRRYFEENRKSWRILERRRERDRRVPLVFHGPDGEIVRISALSEDPDRDFDRPFTPRDMAIDQVRQIEEDLARISGSSPEPGDGNEIDWDEAAGEMRIGPNVICRFAKQARNIRPILSSFQALGWPEKIPDPLRSAGKTDPQALVQALTDLGRKTRGHLHFWQKLGYVHWARQEGSQDAPH
jgi:hypothetical protein